MQDQPRSAPDSPNSWGLSLAFLKYAIAFLLAGSLLYLTAALVLLPDQSVRALGALSALLVGIIGGLLLWRGRIEATVYVLSAGLWAIVTGMAVFTGGLQSAACIIYPQIILLLGWFISARAAIVAAVLTAATTMAFALAESWGFLPEPFPTPPAMRWIIQGFVFATSAVLVVFLVRSYQNRLKEAAELSNGLAQRSAEVQAREADLNRAQAVAHVGSWVYELVTDTMHLSAETCRIFGLPEGTKGNRNAYLSRVHPEDRDAVDSSWQAAMNAGAPFDDEHRIMVGKTIRWIRQNSELKRDADGAPLRCVGITQDITERKLASEALQASERRFRDLLQNVPSVAVQGYGMDGTTQYWNLASERLYGYSAQEAIGQNLLNLIIPPEMRQDVEQAIRRMGETGQAIPSSELSLMRRDGSRVPVFSSHTLVQTPGRAPELFCIDIDLTELKQHEAEVLSARNQLNATLEAIPDLLFEVGLDGRYYACHAPRTEFLVAPPEDLIGTTMRDVLPAATADICMAALREAHETGHSFGRQYELLVLKGRMWFELSVARKPVDPGQEPRFVFLARDITERKLAEDAVRKKEAHLRTLVLAIPDLIWVKDPDGVYLSCNQMFERLYAAKEADIIGRTDYDFVPRELADFFRENDRMAIAAGKPSVNEEWLTFAEDGYRGLFETIKTPMRDAQGTLVGVLGIARDITARKVAELELIKSNAFRELLLEALPLPVFHKDVSGRYAGCNSAFAAFLGKPVKEIAGKTVFELAPKQFAQTYRDRDLDLLQGPIGAQTYESQVMHADRTNHDVIFHKARMVDEAGRAIGILGVMTDITEIRRIEAARDQFKAQLLESQKMQALGTLAGGVAHDFNNVIATIMGNVELALQDIGPEHTALDSLEEIRKASRRAKDLVQQILTFGRRQPLAREVMALEPAVVDSVHLLRSTIPAGVSLNVRCEADAPAVLANRTQIEQVLLNLCANAWQAMLGQQRPATIEIRLSAHKAGGAPYTGPERRSGGGRVALHPGLYTCLMVRDNGPGMDEATAARIFEPFFTTKPVGKGTGLGLAVVHGILQEHQASIELQTLPGVGTTFRIYFPAAQAPAQVAPPSAKESAAVKGQGKHLLYLDDDDSIVYLMKRILDRQGYRVSGYTDQEEALAAVRANPRQFDLAVTDYNMPGMSGLDVARALREIRADLPVALASGHITDELRASAPAAGVIELIYKPNTVDELCETVARLTKALAD